VCIKGCFNYGLKNVATAMYKNSLIKSKWVSECKNGLDSMIYAKKSYERGESIDQDLIVYNKQDCVVLSEILDFLREKKFV
jgi:hypothetical protein